MHPELAALALDAAYSVGVMVTLERPSLPDLEDIRLLPDRSDEMLSLGDAKITSRTCLYRLLVAEIGSDSPKGWVIVFEDGSRFVIQTAALKDSQRLEWRGVANPIQP